MNFFEGIIRNTVLLSAVLAYTAACIVKIVIKLITTKKFSVFSFFEPGGMPSSHSAFVTGAATSVGIKFGFETPMFALAAVISVVVMYDAQGVRRASGKQAAAINSIIENFKQLEKVLDKRLIELIGHTPVEVFAGGTIGIIAGWIVS